ncbi:AI-2E family transporter [Neosynechococcus sphagnicola]|uniref:AI-2E family transporter n=1 Tax=Neosynechococcus sphagnicola TaxID=1501145 RepID=UPI0006914BCA|nr:AI-2E family transporter [Neosynechococcus sphagnicola]
MKFGAWLGLIALMLSLYILWQIRQLLLLVFTAVVLATALNRLARRWQRLGMQRPWAVLAAVGVLVLFFTLVFFLIVPPFTEQFQELQLLVPQGLDRITHWLNSFKVQLPQQVEEVIPDSEHLLQQMRPYANRLLGGSLVLVSGSLNFVLNLLLLLVLALMFLANPQGYRQLFIRLFPAFYRPRMAEILSHTETALAAWIVGALMSMGVISILSWLGLFLLQVKLPLANAVLAGLLNFIPNVGPAFSVVPPMAIALLDDGLKAVFVLILYFGIQQFESSLLTPYIMAQQVALLPALTLLCQVFFATIFGFFGLVMAIPLTVVGQVWLREILVRDVLDQWGGGQWPGSVGGGEGSPGGADDGGRSGFS